MTPNKPLHATPCRCTRGSLVRFAYQPTEYPLRDGLIARITTSSTVSVTNSQTSTATITVNEHVGYAPFNTDLKTITEAMVAQARKEISKNGGHVGAGGKSISLKVNSLY